MSLIARHFEANGIATVIIGSALDIVSHCGVPRFLFSDFPLGNPCGLPYDTAMQRDIIERALTLLESAEGPRTTLQSPHRWDGDPAWRELYMQVRDEDRPKLLKLGQERRAFKAKLKAAGQVRQS